MCVCVSTCVIVVAPCVKHSPTNTHSGKQTIQEVGINHCSMETAERSVEDESCEGRMVVASDTDIDPRAMVVHLHHTPVGRTGGKERSKRVY